MNVSVKDKVEFLFDNCKLEGCIFNYVKNFYDNPELCYTIKDDDMLVISLLFLIKKLLLKVPIIWKIDVFL
jgi:hypothetical protein